MRNVLKKGSAMKIVNRWVGVCGVSLLLAAFVSRIEAAEPPLRVAIAARGKEFAELQKHLESNFHVTCVRIDADKGKGIPDAAKLADCDVMLLNHYRAEPTPEQLEHIKKYFLSGKPVVGTRKASHAYQNWLEIDKVVLGAKYGGHFLLGKQKEPISQVFSPKGKENLQVKDVKLAIPGGGLYKYTELASDVEVLIEGGHEGNRMPQTWRRVNKERGNQRVFYTRYDPNDVNKYADVREMVVKALFWAADRDMEKARRKS